MDNISVRVPGMLLSNPVLSHSAKLLWMTRAVWGRHQPELAPGFLISRSGLAPHTVRRCLAELTDCGWLEGPPAENGGHRRWAAVSDDLLLERRFGVPAKLVYCVLQLTAGFKGVRAMARFSDVAHLAGMSHNTVKQAVRTLEETGWLEVSQENKFSPIVFTLLNPHEEHRKAEAEAARLRINEAVHKSETLMKEILSLIVVNREYQDNARPSYLINPETGKRMEFDRYYPPDVAFEYNGLQHYVTTALYPQESKVQRQRSRDLMKIGTCQTAGITLVLVHLEDLNVDVMLEKVKGLLPLRDLAGHGALIRYLNATGAAYLRKAQRDRTRK